MALTTINSDGVKDDSIVNADIKSDAAIAGTKVAPDFGSQNIATTGNASIGGTNLNMSTAYIDFSGSISTPSTAAAIYRPADNNLAFSTANTERLLIHTSGITITGNSYVTGNDDHPDNSQARFGTSNDLSIFHDGNNSFIKDSGTGRLSILTSQLQVTNAADSEVMIKATQNDAVELYHNGGLKFTTFGDGIKVYGEEGGDGIIKLMADEGDDSADVWQIKVLASSGLFQIEDNGSGSYLPKIQAQGGSAGAVFLSYGNSQKLYTSDYGANVSGIIESSANVASNYAGKFYNDGNATNRYGILVQCGKDNNAGTNVALCVKDGDGTTQGHLTFNAGTLEIDPFTAAHPCIIPDADNPSDDSMAYPYGTLLETTAIEYKKKKDGSDTERGIIYKVQKTQSANSKKILGAYSGSMNNGPDNDPNMHHVYILGDGHILVNNAGGNIEVGDGICSSATAGIGQKATANPSMIIGIAQEAITFTGSETKLVAVQYGLQQFIPWT